MPKKITKKFNYDQVIWGKKEASGSIFSSGSLLIAWILKAFRPIKKGRVLDVGCGGGQFVKALAKTRKDLTIFGVDIGRKAVFSVKKNYPRVFLTLADGQNLPYENNSFSAVFSIEVLEHVCNPKKMIKEMSRVLKKNGRFYLSVSCEKSPWTIQGWLNRLGIDLTTKTIGHINKLSYDEVCQILSKNNLKIIDRFYFGHFFRQFQDLFYVLYLGGKPGRKPGELWQKAQKGREWKQKMALIVYKLAIALMNLETRFFYRFPGVSLQIVAEKK